MKINDLTFETTIIRPGYDTPATSQNQDDLRRAKNDPEFAAYLHGDAWWVDKGFHVGASRQPNGVEVTVHQYFTTREEAEALAVQFPKGVRIKVSGLRGSGVSSGVSLHSITGRFSFQSDGVTGAKNETSIKRWESFKKTVTKLGITVNWDYGSSNSISFEQVEAHNS